MHRHKCVCSALLSFLLWTSAAGSAVAQDTGRSSLDDLLDTPPFDRALWGVLIEDAQGATVFARNADRLFTPASTAKIIVSAAASALLPPSFSVATSVYGTGPLADGTLDGDLVVYGRGDPTFVGRCYGTDTLAVGACDSLWTRIDIIADTVVARGLRHVTGAIVGDGSWFEPQLIHPAWETYDLNWWYAAPVSALGFNDNSVNVIWGPGPAVDAPAAVRFEPALNAFLFENRTRTVQRGGARSFDYFREPGTLRMWAEGTVPLGMRERTDYFALPDPNLYFAQALRAALAARGVSVAGPSRSTVDPGQYQRCQSCPDFGSIRSRPVADWIYPILNASHNWVAEMLLKVLGAELGGEASWDAGLAVERAFLADSVGIDSTHATLSDGSGLAAHNLLTPRALVGVLRFMRDHPRGEAFYSGLAVGGVSGTLRTRYVSSDLNGRVIAKTGTISRVNTLAGYIELPDGDHLTFAIMLNHHGTSWGRAMRRIDAVVRAAVDQIDP